MKRVFRIRLKGYEAVNSEIIDSTKQMEIVSVLYLFRGKNRYKPAAL